MQDSAKDSNFRLIVLLPVFVAISVGMILFVDANEERMGPRVPQVDAVSSMEAADNLCDRTPGGKSVNEIDGYYICHDADGAPIARWIAGQL